LNAAIGAGETFEHGRDLSAWLGLVPRQAVTGGKRGNGYLREDIDP
jgi:transposase